MEITTAFKAAIANGSEFWLQMKKGSRSCLFPGTD
jgi:hypothetical protein